MKSFPVNLPDINEDDIKAVSETLQGGWVSGESPAIADFENDFANTIGVKYGVAVSNGSTALELAFSALNLLPGDEVILPSFTIISCLAPILRMGLAPVFVDSDLSDWNMDAKLVLDAITPKTKAILIVHIYGLSVDMDPILEIARRRNIRVIEDCAEVQGVKYKNKPCGSYGDISTFSFYSNKLITTGEGGMCLTNNNELAKSMQELRSLAQSPERRFMHQALGFNFRMTSMQAALGTSQLKRAEQYLKHKKQIAEIYREKFASLKKFVWQPETNCVSENSYWVFGLFDRSQSISAAVVAEELSKIGVATRPFFYPLSEQPVLKKYPHAKSISHCPNAISLGEYGFYLPSGNGFTLQDIIHISELALPVLLKLEGS
jgi:perosamine synthetase